MEDRLCGTVKENLYRPFPFISDLDCYSVFRKENMFL